MARATRSQRPPKASQSQPRGSQRRVAEEEEDQVEDDAEMELEPEIEEGDMDAEDSGENTLRRKANDLVRLALFSENRRTPLRRDEISKKVLGSNTRAFAMIFSMAQDILKKTFGMELVELSSRGANAQANGDGGGDELDEARKATGVKRKAGATGSKSYILRSTLDSAIIEQAAHTDEAILEEEALDAPDGSDDEDEDEGGSGTGIGRYYGCIINWSRADQLALVGVLYVVLALVLVSGRVMSDTDLRANLKRLRLPFTATLPLTSRSTAKSLPTETYLSQLIRQSYLERNRVGDAKSNTGAGAKRGRKVNTGGDDGAGTWEWRWGPRAFSEVGEAAIGKFVAEFMAGGMGAEGHDGEGEDNGDKEKSFKGVMKGVERAAGGKLSDLV